jgi:hypothetical protein
VLPARRIFPNGGAVMASKRLGGSALATQTLPGVHVFSENSSSFTRDCRPLQGPRYEFGARSNAFMRLGRVLLCRGARRRR